MIAKHSPEEIEKRKKDFQNLTLLDPELCTCSNCPIAGSCEYSFTSYNVEHACLFSKVSPKK